MVKYTYRMPGFTFPFACGYRALTRLYAVTTHICVTATRTFAGLPHLLPFAVGYCVLITVYTTVTCGLPVLYATARLPVALPRPFGYAVVHTHTFAPTHIPHLPFITVGWFYLVYWFCWFCGCWICTGYTHVGLSHSSCGLVLVGYAVTRYLRLPRSAGYRTHAFTAVYAHCVWLRTLPFVYGSATLPGYARLFTRLPHGSHTRIHCGYAVTIHRGLRIGLRTRFLRLHVYVATVCYRFTFCGCRCVYAFVTFTGLRCCLLPHSRVWLPHGYYADCSLPLPRFTARCYARCHHADYRMPVIPLHAGSTRWLGSAVYTHAFYRCGWVAPRTPVTDCRTVPVWLRCGSSFTVCYVYVGYGCCGYVTCGYFTVYAFFTTCHVYYTRLVRRTRLRLPAIYRSGCV